MALSIFPLSFSHSYINCDFGNKCGVTCKISFLDKVATLKKLEAFVILLRNSQGICSPVTVANKQPAQTSNDSKECHSNNLVLLTVLLSCVTNSIVLFIQGFRGKRGRTGSQGFPGAKGWCLILPVNVFKRYLKELEFKLQLLLSPLNQLIQ